MKKKIIIGIALGLTLVGVLLYKNQSQPVVGATLAEMNNSSCAVHGLCTYDGISYAYLIEKGVKPKDYPKTKAEFDQLKTILK